MARIPPHSERTGVLVRLITWYSRRRFGMVPEPVLAAAHHPGVLLVQARLQLGIERRWTRLDPTLRHLAQLAAAARINCSWCIDFGYWIAHARGVPEAKLRDVPRWRDSDAYTDTERLVLEYAEAMTETPPAVTDGLVAELRRHLSDAELVELTAHVATENLWSRFNSALGLTAQGFRDRCEVPAG